MIRRVIQAFLAAIILAGILSTPAVARDVQAKAKKVEGASNLQTISIDGDTLFAFNDDKLSPGGKKALDNLLKKNIFNAMTRQMVTGHTDRIGNAEANRALSLRRAEAVRKYLESKDRNLRFEAQGMGDTKPVVTCSDKLPKNELVKCLAPNRRVEIDPISG